MFKYIYIYEYVCLFTYNFICIYIYYIYMYMYMYMYINICTYMFTMLHIIMVSADWLFLGLSFAFKKGPATLPQVVPLRTCFVPEK